MNTHAKVLSGRYVLEEEVEKTDFAVVYRAFDKVVQRIVAIAKVDIKGDDREIVKRFQQEAAILSHLSHPNIVKVYDVIESNQSEYLVMEYVAGQSLREKLKTSGPLPISETIRLAEQTLLALSYLHSRGIIHRDIKPENILMQPNGKAYLADFGVARVIEKAGSNLSGQWHYLPPEAAAGTRTLDGRSDIYSLAITLFEILTGKTPHPSSSTSVQTLPPDVSRELALVLRRGMEFNPENRWQSAEEFLRALEVASETQEANRNAPNPMHKGKSLLPAALLKSTLAILLSLTVLSSMNSLLANVQIPLVYLNLAAVALVLLVVFLVCSITVYRQLEQRKAVLGKLRSEEADFFVESERSIHGLLGE